MAASFPVTFPSALSVTGTQTLQDVGHTDNLHVKDRDEIIAAQTKLGLGSSVASGTTALLGTGGTQSAWGQITNAYISGTAAISVSKLAPASANGSVLTTAAGTATWALLTNDNIAGTAAIAVSKLGTVTASRPLVSNAGGTLAAGTITTDMIAANAVTQTMGTASFVDNPTTTSTSFVDMTAMVGTLVTTGGDLVAMFTGVTTNNVAGKYVAVGFALDGADTVDIVAYTPPTAGYYGNTGCFYRWTGVSAGTHAVKSRWRSDSGGTASIFGRTLMLMELKK